DTLATSAAETSTSAGGVTTPCSHLLTVDGWRDRRRRIAQMAEANSRVLIPASLRAVVIAPATSPVAALPVMPRAGARGRPGRQPAVGLRSRGGRSAAPDRTGPSTPR